MCVVKSVQVPLWLNAWLKTSHIAVNDSMNNRNIERSNFENTQFFRNKISF